MELSRLALTLVLLLAAFPLVNAEVDFYIVGVEPQKLEPGESSYLNLTLKNLGTDYATRFKAYLDPQATTPFYPSGPQKVYVQRKVEGGGESEYFGAIIQDKEVTISIPIKVSRNAGFGSYLVPLKLEYFNPQGKKEETTLSFGMEVAGEAEFALGGVNTSPSRLYPDQEFALAVNLENTGTGKARDLRLNLELPQGITGETSEQLGTLARDSRAVAGFNLKTTGRVEPGSHTAVLHFSYREEGGEPGEASFPLEIFVFQRGEITLELAGLDTSPRLLHPGESFTLSLQIQNIGEQDAKAVRVEISPQRALVGETTSYLGNLKQDDTSTAIYDLEVEGQAEKGKVEVPLTIFYKDEKGESGRIGKEASLSISSREGNNYRLYGAAGVMVLVILLFWWKRRGREEEI